MKKIAPSPPPVIRKAIAVETGVKGQSIPSFNKQSNQSKINFAYNDLFSTPKYNKSQQDQSNGVASPSPFIQHPSQPLQ